jgi:hypothetical protein
MEENKMTHEKVNGFQMICPYCHTKMISIYKKQLDFNFKVHLETCEEKPNNGNTKT